MGRPKGSKNVNKATKTHKTAEDKIAKIQQVIDKHLKCIKDLKKKIRKINKRENKKVIKKLTPEEWAKIKEMRQEAK